LGRLAAWDVSRASLRQMWDLGGQAALRTSWPVYYKHTDAIIVVVDSTDRARLGLVKAEVDRLLASEELKQASILIYANKQARKPGRRRQPLGGASRAPCFDRRRSLLTSAAARHRT
jgi:GTPase SAR1 family protein